MYLGTFGFDNSNSDTYGTAPDGNGYFGSPGSDPAYLSHDIGDNYAGLVCGADGNSDGSVNPFDGPGDYSYVFGYDLDDCDGFCDLIGAFGVTVTSPPDADNSICITSGISFFGMTVSIGLPGNTPSCNAPNGRFYCCCVS